MGNRIHLITGEITLNGASVLTDGQISSITKSGTTATVTTAAAHGFSIGDTVVITGAVGGQVQGTDDKDPNSLAAGDAQFYNGTFQLTAASGTTMTYTMPGTPGANASSGSGSFRIVNYRKPPNVLIQAKLFTVKPCKLFNLVGFNNNASLQYLQLFDLNAAPAGGAVPEIVLPIPSVSDGSMDFAGGKLFQRGLYIALSSSGPTYTAPATKDLIISIDINQPYATQQG